MLGLTSRPTVGYRVQRAAGAQAKPLASRPASRMQLRATAEAKTESKKKKKGEWWGDESQQHLCLQAWAG